MSRFWFPLMILAYCLGVAVGCCSQHPAGTLPAPPVLARGVVVDVTEICPAPAPGMKGRSFVGTGVAVTSSEVLTARHVTECAIDGVKYAEPLAWYGQVRGGHPVQLYEEVGASTADVARLVAAPGSFAAVPLVVGPRPKKGDRVCWTHAWPSRGETCGDVTSEGGDVLEVSGPAEPGNSGSPTYDAAGRLVGVVIEWRADPDGRISGAGIVDVTGDLSWVAAAGIRS